MNVGPVAVLGGPLDGNAYDLEGDPGSFIELNSAAGVCVYRFALSEAGLTVLHYVGPAGPGDPEKEGTLDPLMEPTDGTEF